MHNEIFYTQKNNYKMNKFFTLFVAICLIGSAFAQERSGLPKEKMDISIERTIHPAQDVVTIGLKPNNTAPSVKATSFENEVSLNTTEYDLQSNANLGNRFIQFDDGTMATTCTRGFGNPAFSDRGTGYSYFDGTDWNIKPERIEANRAGWPAVTNWGENGEIVVSHYFNTAMVLNKREIKGEGEWTEVLIPNLPSGSNVNWPRVVTCGENNNTIVVCGAVSVEGIVNEFYINTSNDGGDNWTGWDDPDNLMDEYNFNISADDYVMAAKGDNVVIAFGSAWYDLFYIKSTDCGENWERTVVWEHPYPQLDFNTLIMPTEDTLRTVDNSISLALTTDGQVHLAWGITRVGVYDNATPGSYSYWPYTDGIGYWNETMGEIPTNPEDPMKTMSAEYLNSLGLLVGWCPDWEDLFELELNSYRELGVSTMPALSVDDEGRAGLAYASTTHYNDGAYYFKHLYLVNGLNGIWTEPEDLTSSVLHSYDEIIYPVTPYFTTGADWKYVCQIDVQPGVLIDGDPQTEPTTNTMTYLTTPKYSDNVSELSNAAATLNISPNPANNFIKIDTDMKSDAIVTIFSITGQKVIETEKNKQSFTIDISSLKGGIYFVRLDNGQQQISKKIVVE